MPTLVGIIATSVLLPEKLISNCKMFTTAPYVNGMSNSCNP